MFYKEASGRIDDPASLRLLYLKSTGALAAIIAVPMIILFLWAPQIFSFVFGADWRFAGECARWMSLWLGCGFINPPSVMLYNVFGAQRLFFIFGLLSLLLRIITLYGGSYLSLSPIHTIAAYSIASVLIQVPQIATMFVKVRAYQSTN